MNILLNIFWSIWEVKYILFWLYLWQLKEYHFGRFSDHFRTYKGKKTFFDVNQIIKLALLAFLFYLPILSMFWESVVVLLYIGEFLIILRAIYKKSFKKPVFTPKMAFLTMVSFSLLITFSTLILTFEYTSQVRLVLLFDLLTPLTISFIVILFQPIFVILRNNTIIRAKKKLEEIRGQSGLRVIAITGSYGKTTTKEFLYTILASKYKDKVLKTPKHQNSEVGIAKEILQNLTPEHQFFIAEIGAYNRGKVKEVCSFLKPSLGMVTGVNEQHLSLFGSMENLLLAEGGVELEESLPEDGLLIVNGDNKYCVNLYKQSEKNKKIYAESNKRIDADIFTEDITASRSGVSFISMDKYGNTHHFFAKVLGKHNVHNLLAAIVASHNLGMTFEEISTAYKDIVPEQAGMTLAEGKHGIHIIDSSYSANPDGVFADLDYLSLFNQKKVIVMPSLIELGNRSGQIHYKIGKKIAHICDLAIITTRDQFINIKNCATDEGMLAKNVVFCEKPSEIYAMVTLLCKAGDAVLLEGRVPSG